MEPCQEKIVFFGTSEFAAIVLKGLFEAGLAPLAVITNEDKPAGRKQLLAPSPVKSFILGKGTKIPLFQPAELDSALHDELLKLHPDLFIVAAYGHILPESFIKLPAFGALNVHPSLLPKYRGPSPVQTAILQGEKITGATVMLLDEKVDHGPILLQQEFTIPEGIYYEELHNELAKIGTGLLIQCIPDFIKGKLKPIPQDDSKATTTRIFRKEDGKIDWKSSAVYIERQVRALNPWPGAYTFFQGKLLKILKARVLKIEPQEPGKTFLSENRNIGVFAKENALILETIQLEGKKPVSSREFALGHKDFVNTILQ